MTEKQAKYYKRCIELGTISAAAEELFVSRSVISRMINDLEVEFNATLIERRKQGVIPTAAGKLLYDKICCFVNAKADLIKQIEELK